MVGINDSVDCNKERRVYVRSCSARHTVLRLHIVYRIFDSRKVSAHL